MVFPDSPRVIYGRNTLTEVLVDLRFPPVLRIEAEPPVSFQEAIRFDFPNYRFEPAKPFFPPNFPPQLVQMIETSQARRKEGGKHQFVSLDEKWTVNLLRGAIELRTTAYRSWEEFRGRLTQILAAFEAAYPPVNYTRVGLRYFCLIKRSVLELTDVPWKELLKPWISGTLSAPGLSEKIDSMSGQTHCALDRENHFLVLKTGMTIPDAATHEKCFLMDCDFHTHHPTENAHVLGTLDEFNRCSGRLFRYSIEQRLHDAMEPRPVVEVAKA
jgi:uncharacterized protein (TIGR04255 family)